MLQRHNTEFDWLCWCVVRLPCAPSFKIGGNCWIINLSVICWWNGIHDWCSARKNQLMQAVWKHHFLMIVYKLFWVELSYCLTDKQKTSLLYWIFANFFWAFTELLNSIVSNPSLKSHILILLSYNIASVNKKSTNMSNKTIPGLHWISLMSLIEHGTPS